MRVSTAPRPTPHSTVPRSRSSPPTRAPTTRLREPSWVTTMPLTRKPPSDLPPPRARPVRRHGVLRDQSLVPALLHERPGLQAVAGQAARGEHWRAVDPVVHDFRRSFSGQERTSHPRQTRQSKATKVGGATTCSGRDVTRGASGGPGIRMDAVRFVARRSTLTLRRLADFVSSECPQ